MPAISWIYSVRGQIIAALLLLFSLAAASIGYTLYEVDLRKHDYEILNLAGQLRVVSRGMAHQARNFLNDDAADQAAAELYTQDLRDDAGLYGKIVQGFRERRLDPELTGKDEPLVCNWDRHSRSQLDISAADWDDFSRGLRQSGDAGGALAAARYVAEHGGGLEESADRLVRAFQAMMEGKLATIRLANQVALAVMLLVLALIVAIVHYRILRPLSHAVRGFERVAKGDLGFQVPVVGRNEFSHMAQAFNRLSDRLRGLFRLTDRIGSGTNLHDALKFVQEEFRTFLPVDWVGVFLWDGERRRLTLERHCGAGGALRDGAGFTIAAGLPDEVRKGQPHLFAELEAYPGEAPFATLAGRLCEEGLHSTLLLPLTPSAQTPALLLFASREAGAYTPDHVEFLANIGQQISHILERTVVMEGLVVAAVEGLAKLAESRDPETGDHLVRMSLYSAIVAEELGRGGAYRERIDQAYVRDILRFAPMHDIGKVGVRDEILLKPGRLTPEERALMEVHPVTGGQVLRRCEAQMNALGRSIFQIGIEIAEGHHEKFDGSGYPKRLAGEEIPLSARIIAAADVFDALTSKRPYKEAWPVEKALETMKSDAGKHFDPEVLAALERALPQILEIYARLKHV